MVCAFGTVPDNVVSGRIAGVSLIALFIYAFLEVKDFIAAPLKAGLLILILNILFTSPALACQLLRVDSLNPKKPNPCTWLTAFP
ncbi:hypothetical protein D3C87_1984700 [compost metagenome]